MAWPSERIAQGGVFHPPKVKYSSDTQQFLKVLLNESKLDAMQRKKSDYSLRSGSPIRCSQKSRSSYDLGLWIKEPKILIRPGPSRKRNAENIVNSGAYVRERFVPLHPRVDRDMAKKHLQHVMAFGKEAKPEDENAKKKDKKKKDEEDEKKKDFNRFDELAREIQERKDFLKEMEKLGEAEKHKLVIQQQIQARVREMGKLKLSNS